MTYKLSWLIENEIIYAEFSGVSDQEELRELLTQITNMRKQSQRDTVHTITYIDSTAFGARFQDSMKVMQEFQTTENDGWEIVVGKLSKIMQLSLRISRSVMRSKSINFETMSEAFEHLKKEDSTLTWNKLNRDVIDHL